MHLYRFIGLPLVLIMLFACRASYPPGTAEESIAQICQREYGVQVQVKSRGHTLGALVVTQDVLLSDLNLSDQALNKIENVMLAASRVTLSSGFPYEFFVVSLLDPATGIQVSFVRYIKDIRRLIMDDISRNDYFQRMIIETEARPPVAPGVAVDYDLKEYFLPDFLAKQISDRIQLQFQMNLVIERLFHIAGLEGSFIPDLAKHSAGKFRLQVYFFPDAAPFSSLGNIELRKNFAKLLLHTAQTVTRRYEFQDFDGLEIIDQAGNTLAYYDRAEFSKDTVNALMELIRSIKPKAK